VTAFRRRRDLRRLRKAFRGGLLDGPSLPLPEPLLIYDAGERRTHAEHAAEAYDFQRRAENLLQLDVAVSERCAATARWHATMAVYEALAERGRDDG
jgi:hypothetical protein